MTDGIQIEIYYHYSELDKEHCYGVCCNHSSIDYGNYWIYWLWYHMGEAFKKRKFRLYPFDPDVMNFVSKPFKSYKTVNTGTTKVIPAILKHFSKLSHSKPTP